jgi:hypothetical protein
MDRILADDFVPVTGRGKTYSKADLSKEARRKAVIYEHQKDSDQRVRVRTPTGWRYVFGQASPPLPKEP